MTLLENTSTDWTAQVSEWCDQLASDDYIVIDDILSSELYQEIRSFFLSKLEEDDFNKAGIGAQSNHQVVEAIRGDFVYWLDANRDEPIHAFFGWIEELRVLLNRNLMLSMSDYEFHLAHYPAGTYYKRHLDQFKGRNNRLLTVIIYLNENWQPGDGGELKIIKERSEKIIQPIANRGIIFRSDTIPHEVLTTNKSRYSLTGWLLYRPVGIGYL